MSHISIYTERNQRLERERELTEQKWQSITLVLNFGLTQKERKRLNDTIPCNLSKANKKKE